MASEKPRIDVNGTAYRWPQKPVVVVCIDGGDPAKRPVLQSHVARALSFR